MLFNSIEFLIFAAFFFIAWPLLRRWNNPRWIYLTAVSFFFYGWWDWRFLFLLIGTATVDFLAALAMERWPRLRKLILVLSLLSNFGVLGLFKYSGFAARNANWVLHLFGVEYTVPVMNLILPVGISFYTFQSLSYTIDVYRGQLKATRNIFHFLAFVSLFPQLVAGPIIRASSLLPQLTHWNRSTHQQQWDGLCLIVQGYFKKVVVADTIAPIVNEAFASTLPIDSGAYWWLIVTYFAFQIYCDFSGYSDIARGLAKWMGYEFMVNFDHPYISTSIREYWTRWHISLSTWFRDYLYIPLGGNRHGDWAAHRNMWIAMVTSGFWHGANWTFLIWGGLHAFYLSMERLTQWPKRLSALPGGRHVAVLIIFAMVLVSWVFFRAHSLDQALGITVAMFDVTHFNWAGAMDPLRKTAFVFLVVMLLRQAYFHLRFNEITWWLVPQIRMFLQPAGIAALIWASIYLRGPGSAFIYFQF